MEDRPYAIFGPADAEWKWAAKEVPVSATKESQQGVGGGPALAWSGDDPVAYTRAMAALEDAQIPVFPITEHDQFSTVPQISGPSYRVFVPSHDLARAQKAIRDALASNPQQE